MNKFELKNETKKFKENFSLFNILLILLIGGGAFFGGTKYQQSNAPKDMPKEFDNSAFSGRNRNMPGEMGNNNSNQNGVGQRRMGNNQSIGDITGIDDKSITIKTTDGSSRIILLSDKTTVSKATTAALTDLKVGDKVMVFGTPNNDGSISGTSIQLNPSMPNIPSGAPTGTSTKTN